MHQEVQAIEADAPVEKLIEIASKTGKSVSGYPVVDAIGNLQGFLSRSEVLEYIANVPSAKNQIAVRELLTQGLVVAFPDEPLRVAADRMAKVDADSLPVVDVSDNQHVVGLLSREDIFNARVLWFAEEKERESFLSISRPKIKKSGLNWTSMIHKIMSRKQKSIDEETSPE
jgi:CBS domain-containing protein